jgi:hypothetical protein
MATLQLTKVVLEIDEGIVEDEKIAPPCWGSESRGRQFAKMELTTSTHDALDIRLAVANSTANIESYQISFKSSSSRTHSVRLKFAITSRRSLKVCFNYAHRLAV